MVLSSVKRLLAGNRRGQALLAHGRKVRKRFISKQQRTEEQVRHLTGAFRVYVVDIKPYLMTTLNALGGMEGQANRSNGRLVLLFQVAVLTLMAGAVLSMLPRTS
jgi:hypothetical protein